MIEYIKKVSVYLFNYLKLTKIVCIDNILLFKEMIIFINIIYFIICITK